MRKLRFSKKMTVLFIVIIIALTATTIVALNKPKLEVDATTVDRGPVIKLIEEDGTVKSRMERLVSTKISAEVMDIIVTQGDKVEKGDIIAILDSSQIELQIKAIDAQIQALKSKYNKAIEPANETEVSIGKIKLDSVKLELDSVEATHKNNEALYESGAISKDEFLNSQKEYELKKQDYEIAKNQFALLSEGISTNIRNQYEAQIAEIVYQKQILEDSLLNTKLPASFEGTITDIYVREGQIVQDGSRIAEINNLDDLYIESNILATKVTDVKQGALVEVILGDNTVLKGNVSRVFPKAFSKTSDLGIEQKRVIAQIEISKSDKLRIGDELTCKVQVGKKNNVLRIPIDSVFKKDKATKVFVIKNGKTMIRDIKVGFEGEDYYEVLKGIVKGDKVVNAPSNDMEEGTSVTIKNVEKNDKK